MQYIQDACLTNLMISSIFVGPHHKPYGFGWDRILNRNTFDASYNHEDAQALLQFSFIVTDSAAYNLPMNVPKSFKSVEVKYDSCPAEFVFKGIAKSGYNDPAPVAYVFYNEASNVLLIGFVGTINMCMAGLDLKYTQVEFDSITNYVPGLKGHGGIYAVYKSIRDKLISAITLVLERRPQVVITGHSLGGGLSQICALELAAYDPIHYSFASPMVFNEVGHSVFKEGVKCSYRVANVSDLVTISPLPIMPNKDAFFHVGELVSFQRNFGDYEKNHTQAYVDEYGI